MHALVSIFVFIEEHLDIIAGLGQGNHSHLWPQSACFEWLLEPEDLVICDSIFGREGTEELPVLLGKYQIGAFSERVEIRSVVFELDKDG